MILIGIIIGGAIVILGGCVWFVYVFLFDNHR
jgi:hypothetical protein